jgi:protein required for attachment to host cells
MSNKTMWLVIADNAGARVHALEPRSRDATLIAEIDHAAGRLHNRELVTDRPGQGQSDAGSRPYGFAPRASPVDHEREHFARRLADVIDEGARASRFGELALVMPPKLLGLVREALGNNARALIVGELDQRLIDQPISAVVEKVTAVRRPAPLA